MRRFILGIVLGLTVAVTPAAVEASIFASSYLQVDDFVIMNVATGVPVTAGVGGDVIVIAVVDAATATANLDGPPPGVVNVAASLDATVAYQDSGAGAAPADDAVLAILPPHPGTPVGLAVVGPAEHYALADTTTDGGTAVTVLPGPVTGGVEVETFAEVSVDETMLPVDTGDAAGTVASSTLFIRILTPLTVFADFDALVDIVLDQTAAPPPANLTLLGSVSWAMTLTGSGVISVGGVVTPVFIFAPAALNTGTLSNSTPGTVGGYSLPDTSFTTPVVTLGPGTYALSFTQGSAAAIGVIPEPASVLTWALLVVFGCGVLTAYSRRRNEI